MNIDREIQQKEIELSVLKLKKQYGEFGKMPIGDEKSLIAFLQAKEVIYPSRVFVVNSFETKDYACLKTNNELSIGGYRYNDRHRGDCFYLQVDKNGNVVYQDGINSKLEALKYDSY